VNPAPPPRLVVGTAPLIAVVRWARARLTEGATELDLDVPDPDAAIGVPLGGRRPDGAVQRDWRAWCDLAEALLCRLHTPAPLPGGRVRLRLSLLGPEAEWHGGPPDRERYTADEGFGALRKLEHPGFLLPLLAALQRVRPPEGGRVLVLGCHRGDEIEALGWLEPPPEGLEVVGVDHAPESLARARSRFPGARFEEHDINDLPAELGRFHLALAIDVLQGPAVDDKRVLRQLVQRHLMPAAGLVLGLPNSRFRGGELVWGARTRNYREPDLSLVVRDLAAHRRYLQQHGFVTHVGGRYDLLLSAQRRARVGA
jgi:hypothetical protein